MIDVERVYRASSLILGDKNFTRFPRARFADSFNGAMADITNNVDFFVKTTFAQTPINYQSIDFGDIANRILRVEYVDVDRHTHYKLSPTGFEKLDSIRPNWRLNMHESSPDWYITNKQNVCQFFLYPSVRVVENSSTARYGIVESNSGQLTISPEFGIIEALNQPYLIVRYAERQKTVVANTANDGFVFEGTTQKAQFEIQEDFMQCLKHYCVAMLSSDDSEELQSELSKYHLSLYQNTLNQLKSKKADGYDDETILSFYRGGNNDYGDGQGSFGGDTDLRRLNY